ncbi:MAG: DNA adenine methylase [Candidatus Micrarchaeota archaeon]|nr:DNA adenine methylase [Candidatus Micrarchaeota archaeon]
MLEEARPFVKWAGGKRQLLDELTQGLPYFENYHEPFIGGGALFFRLEAMNRIKRAYLSDSNAELINAYSVIKNEVFELMSELASPLYVNDEAAYYKIRASRPKTNVERAARFIYMNKTAFNGLYRVNSSGGFNVPFGKYDNPKILDSQNLMLVHRALQKDELYCGDFTIALKNAKRGDFVYFDPPYFPISKTSNFTGYTKDGFGENEQKKLLKTYKELDSKGCFVLLSNSYSDFISELYAEFEPETVHANRMINCKGDQRGKIKELIVRNWEPKITQRKLVEEIVAIN